MYFYGSSKDYTPIVRLIHDFKCKNADEMYYSRIADRVRYIKKTEGGREYMRKMMEDLNQRAAYERQKQIAASLINKRKMAFEAIADLPVLA